MRSRRCTASQRVGLGAERRRDLGRRRAPARAARARSTNWTPSGKRAASSYAACEAIRVFPVPPGPDSVTSRAPPASRSRTSPTWRRRPISGVAGAGSRRRARSSAGSTSSAGSCRRIASSSARSSGPGSSPSSSPSTDRARRYAANASAWRPRAVEREHQLAVRPLAQRLLAGPAAPARQHASAWRPSRNRASSPSSRALEPQRFEPRGLGSRRALERSTPERAAPRRARSAASASSPARGPRAPRARALEGQRVELLGLHRDPVAGRLGDDPLPPGIGLAQLRDVAPAARGARSPADHRPRPRRSAARPRRRSRTQAAVLAVGRADAGRRAARRPRPRAVRGPGTSRRL